MLCINDASDMVAILNSFIMKETTEQKKADKKKCLSGIFETGQKRAYHI